MHFRRVANKKSVLLIGLVYIHSATAATAATSTSTPQPHTECVLIITHCIAFSIVNLDNVPAKAHFHYFASFFDSILSRRGENARASARARVRIISIVGIRNMSKVSYFVYKTVESVQLRDLSAICWLIYRVDCSLTCLFFCLFTKSRNNSIEDRNKMAQQQQKLLIMNEQFVRYEHTTYVCMYLLINRSL